MRIDHVAAIASQSEAFIDAVRTPGALQRRVPCCPDWTVADLVEHLGQVHTFWTLVVRAGGELPDDETIRAAQRPVGDLVDWARQRSAELVDVLGRTPPDVPVSCWWAPDRRGTAAEVASRQAHETLIHRWDAESAAGTPGPADPELWADGVNEFGLRMLNGPAWTGPSGVVALRAVDVGQEWRFGCGSESTAEDGTPRWLVDKRLRPLDAVVTGTAEQLDLLLWHRLDIDPDHVEGDAALLAAFLAWPNLD
jgi:uncharacterized protein (TIGR03083 family)